MARTVQEGITPTTLRSEPRAQTLRACACACVRPCGPIPNVRVCLATATWACALVETPCCSPQHSLLGEGWGAAQTKGPPGVVLDAPFACMCVRVRVGVGVGVPRALVLQTRFINREHQRERCPRRRRQVRWPDPMHVRCVETMHFSSQLQPPLSSTNHGCVCVQPCGVPSCGCVVRVWVCARVRVHLFCRRTSSPESINGDGDENVVPAAAAARCVGPIPCMCVRGDDALLVATVASPEQHKPRVCVRVQPCCVPANVGVWCVCVRACACACACVCVCRVHLFCRRTSAPESINGDGDENVVPAAAARCVGPIPCMCVAWRRCTSRRNCSLP